MSRSSRRPWRAAAGFVAAALVLGACGKKGPPLPPLRPVPARIADLAARLGDRGVTLTFTVPTANADGTTPVAVERIEVYRDVALTPPEPGETPAQPPPAPVPLVSPDNLIATIPVMPPSAEAPESGAIVPGARVTWPDPAPLPGAGPDEGPTWRYVVVPVTGRDRGPGASNLVLVPVGADRPAAPDVRVTYDESAWLVQWTAEGDGAYLVFDVPAGGGTLTMLTPAPIAASPYSAPVEFGRERCFVVRGVDVRDAVTIEGPASAPACATPADTFAPPAPGGLVALQEGTAVVLRWRAVAATDLAGYVVLRGDGAGATLTPLFTAPAAATSYRDEAVQAGSTYIYAVVAVDRATPPNTSGESNRETVVVRDGAGGS